MQAVDCANRCPTCPLRDPNHEPIIMAEVGSISIPVVGTRNYGYTVSLREPAPTVSDVVVANNDGSVISRFLMPRQAWYDGSAKRAFEECTQPTEVRSGFLGLRKSLGCTAVINLSK